MTKTIRAHFDGRVIIPDEPLNLPRNQPLRLSLETATGPEIPSAESIQARLERLEAATGTISGPTPIPDEALRREYL